MITAEIYAHVLPAVRLVMQDKGYTVDTPNAEALAYGALWSYVTHAVEEIFHPPTPEAEPKKKDRRTKVWQYIVRFRLTTPSGSELIAETDVETMDGTAALAGVIEKYAAELHETEYHLLPTPLMTVDQKIPQLRNNLGRYSAASLRIAYDFGGSSYLCEVDVTKPGA